MLEREAQITSTFQQIRTDITQVREDQGSYQQANKVYLQNTLNKITNAITQRETQLNQENYLKILN